MVKCKECGFLVLGSGEGDSPSPSLGYRQTGRRGGGDPNPTPHCLLLAQNLEGEFTDRQIPDQTAADSHGAALTVISTERERDSFFVWHPELTPKEHVEMQHTALLKQEIEDRRIADEKLADQRRRDDAERSQKQSEEDRAWRKEEERSSREWQEQQERKRIAKDFKDKVKIVIIGTACTGIVALASFFGGRYFGTPPEKKDAPAQTAVVSWESKQLQVDGVGCD